MSDEESPPPRPRRAARPPTADDAVRRQNAIPRAWSDGTSAKIAHAKGRGPRPDRAGTPRPPTPQSVPDSELQARQRKKPVALNEGDLARLERLLDKVSERFGPVSFMEYVRTTLRAFEMVEPALDRMPVLPVSRRRRPAVKNDMEGIVHRERALAQFMVQVWESLDA